MMLNKIKAVEIATKNLIHWQHRDVFLLCFRCVYSLNYNKAVGLHIIKATAKINLSYEKEEKLEEGK